MTAATEWLEQHYKEDFLPLRGTPGTPTSRGDAPSYYTELYLPDYDGEVVDPIYARWPDDPSLSHQKIDKAHAAYCGEITMVDAWVGQLLRTVENMGLMEKTAVMFTSDHGFYFGEHDGLFGKMVYAKRPDGTLYRDREPDSQWDHSPLYQELVALPLLVYHPEVDAVRVRDSLRQST